MVYFLSGAPTSREAKEQHNFAGVEQMPKSACELAQTLLERLAAGQRLTDYERGQLDLLDMAMRGEWLLRGELVANDPPAVVLDGPAPPIAEP